MVILENGLLFNALHATKIIRNFGE